MLFRTLNLTPMGHMVLHFTSLSGNGVDLSLHSPGHTVIQTMLENSLNVLKRTLNFLKIFLEELQPSLIKFCCCLWRQILSFIS